MPKNLLLVAAVICAFGLCAAAQPAVPSGSKDQKAAAEHKMDKKSDKKTDKKLHKAPKKAAKKVAKGKAAPKTAAAPTATK